MTPSVQQRMFLGLLSVVIVLTIATNVIVHTLLGNIAEREIQARLNNAVIAYQRFDEQRRELLRTRALSITQSAHLIATLSIPGVDLETVEVAGQYLEGVADLDVLLILDSDGELLADVNDSAIAPHDLKGVPNIERARAGEPSVRLWSRHSNYYQVAVVPVTSNFQIVGMVLAGSRIDNDVALQLAEAIASADVGWTTDDALGGAKRRATAAAATAKALNEIVIDATPQNRDPDGDVFFNAAILYPALNASLVFSEQLDLEKSGVATVEKFVVVTSILVVLLGMILSHRIASRISRPVVHLTQVAGDFGAGDFSARLAPESDDEIGALTVAFNKMADEIVEQRQELVTSLDAAEAASRAKSEFLATMSHEIRTPMNGVLGMAELLLTSDISDQQREYALTILDCSDGLMAIINDILDFSKIEAGRLELNPCQFDVRATIAETAALLSHHAESKGLRLLPSFSPDAETWVYGDKLRFKQILMNLVGNGVKFTREGKVTISAEATELATDAVKLRVDVVDTGPGISPDDLPNVFDSFTQADGSHSRKFGGTGLGLAISKELAELMGGRIGAVSTVGEGSRFWFEVTFPRISNRGTSRSDDRSTESALLSETDLPLSLSVRSVEPVQHNASVLLVEDNMANQKVAIAMLNMLGCDIDLADDGLAAVAKFAESPYDVILMDCQMPNMDGFAATAAIRAMEKEEDRVSPTPVIAVTANALASDRERCLAAGMNDYVSKPFRLGDLKAAIERWLPAAKKMETPVPPLNATVADKSELDELREFGASDAELAEIVTCYVDTSTQSLCSMNDAIARHDREGLRSLAHKLKGGSGQVGALKVASICSELQADAESASWERLTDRVSLLAREVRSANDELTAKYAPSAS